jgi:trimethylamine--corrinoid protein Co-methyltransferase
MGAGGVLDVALLGKLNPRFGPLSTDEFHDPRLIVVINEYVEAMKRLARGFEVSDDTLPLEVVKEVGPGGTFLSHPHTLAHFREEIWTPTLFAGENYESWAHGPRETILDRARTRVLDILESHHPRSMSETTEERLLALIDRFAADLGIAGYTRPDMPD